MAVKVRIRKKNIQVIFSRREGVKNLVGGGPIFEVIYISSVVFIF